MTHPNPTLIPGLRSPYDQTGGIVYFARMLDKIRLHARGELPPDWVAAMGTASQTSFDARCCRFLGIDYDALEKQTLAGGSDDDLLAWAFANGRRPNAEEIEIWNAFMTKRGWRDAMSNRLNERLTQVSQTLTEIAYFEPKSGCF